MAKGSCSCGAITFEVTPPLGGVYLCHCSICRRFSGTHGAAVIVVPNIQFRWLTGKDHVQTWTKPGHDWQAHFCPTCGSAVPGPNDPERMFIPAGSLTEGADALQVVHQIYTDSRAPWVDLCPNGTKHPEGFGSG